MTESHAAVSVATLFEKYGEKLSLSWIGGSQGADGTVVAEDTGTQSGPQPPLNAPVIMRRSLVGHMNLIHPHQIQILGAIELQYLLELPEPGLAETVDRLASLRPACIIIAEDMNPPITLALKCNECALPLFCSPLPGAKLAGALRYYLTEMLAESTILNGVFMEVMDAGVLITGSSGVGKSELALELITRGHRLIADDATKFARTAPETITGSCPELLRDFLEVRGLGIINVRSIYGDGSIKNEKELHLIIRLEPMERSQLLRLDRLDGSYNVQNILDVDITEITLPVAPGRNLAILLECAVRNHTLRSRGYNAPAEFMHKQLELINHNHA